MNRGIFGLIWAAAVSGFLFSAACNDTTADGGPPVLTCASSADCVGAEFCSGGACFPKILVGNCAGAIDHTAAEVCQTGICLGGACCNAACSATDPACNAASCDATSGACQYPAPTVVCGPPESCTNGSHTAASSCDGKGGCTLSQPVPCPAGDFCDKGACVPTPDCSVGNGFDCPSAGGGVGSCCLGHCAGIDLSCESCGDVCAIGYTCGIMDPGGFVCHDETNGQAFPCCCGGSCPAGYACVGSNHCAVSDCSSAPAEGLQCVIGGQPYLCCSGSSGGQVGMCCNGACVDYNHDPSHCGGCATICPAGTSCIWGVCS
jgi:hypothetical protein